MSARMMVRDPEIDGGIDCCPPVIHPSGLRKGVDRHQYFAAFAVGWVTHTIGHGFLVEIQAGEIAGIGVVLNPR